MVVKLIKVHTLVGQVVQVVVVQEELIHQQLMVLLEQQIQVAEVEGHLEVHILLALEEKELLY